MKYYNQKDLTMVFGIIVIGYFSLRYLMTRKLMEGQSNNEGQSNDEECRVNYHVEDGKCIECSAGTYNGGGDDPSGNDTSCEIIICGQNFHVHNNECVKCPTGTYREAGDAATGSNTTCKQCGRDSPEWSNCKGSNNNENESNKNNR